MICFICVEYMSTNTSTIVQDLGPIWSESKTLPKRKGSQCDSVPESRSTTTSPPRSHLRTPSTRLMSLTSCTTTKFLKAELSWTLDESRVISNKLCLPTPQEDRQKACFMSKEIGFAQKLQLAVVLCTAVVIGDEVWALELVGFVCVLRPMNLQTGKSASMESLIITIMDEETRGLVSKTLVRISCLSDQPRGKRTIQAIATCPGNPWVIEHCCSTRKRSPPLANAHMLLFLSSTVLGALHENNHPMTFRLRPR
ncbi:hypothetical protein BD289DRAFT_70529 [Coniella lustricola]|uniref:Uncharacterized protein n=1 Tax=Coniella lustricola TaxID=2025994 RepID=A0A2T2ZZU5_9PEZI|nr:hypothetical protein BD289DRAFT_70529 [Coniella lustricola]